MIREFIELLIEAYRTRRDEAHKAQLFQVETELQIEEKRKPETKAKVEAMLSEAKLIQTKTQILKAREGK